MAKKEIETTETETVTEQVQESTETTKEVVKESKKDKFNGEGYIVKTVDGITSYKETVKNCLSEDEAEKYLGGKKPSEYFYKGIIPNYFVKTFGQRVTAENDFNQALEKFNKVFQEESFLRKGEVILFFNPNGNRYTLLIPKTITTKVLVDGEFVDDFHPTLREKLCVEPFDTRCILFNSIRGGSYNERIFEEECSKLKIKILNFLRLSGRI